MPDPGSSTNPGVGSGANAGLGTAVAPIVTAVANVCDAVTLPTINIEILRLLGEAHAKWADGTKRSKHGAGSMVVHGVSLGLDHWGVQVTQMFVGDHAASYTIVPGILLTKSVNMYGAGAKSKLIWFISMASLESLTGVTGLGLSGL